MVKIPLKIHESGLWSGSGSAPISNGYFASHTSTAPKISSKCDNFLSYPADRQTEAKTRRLLGEGNNNNSSILGSGESR